MITISCILYSNVKFKIHVLARLKYFVAELVLKLTYNELMIPHEFNDALASKYLLLTFRNEETTILLTKNIVSMSS